MSRRVAVTKMHGARNDFVILDRRAQDVSDIAGFARRICDRHTGVGADGVLTIERPVASDVRFRMRVVNADGGEAEMCGNGIRCVARYLDEAGEGETLSIETGAGVIETRVVARDPEYLVRVQMGEPNFEFPAFAIDDAQYVDLGNPHVVLFREALDAFDLSLAGAHFQHSPLFPYGTNVHLAVIDGPHEVRVRHYERGVGLTMACGTGAVAAAAAAIEGGRARSPVNVEVPGGRLCVEWDGRGCEAYLTGPAVRVFDTTIEP